MLSAISRRKSAFTPIITFIMLILRGKMTELGWKIPWKFLVPREEIRFFPRSSRGI